MGLSAARQLAAKGAHVLLVSRSAEKLDKALKEVQVRQELSPTTCQNHQTGGSLKYNN